MSTSSLFAVLAAATTAAAAAAPATATDTPRASVPSPSVDLTPPAPPAGTKSRDVVTYSWKVDGAIVLTTGAGWIGSELLKGNFAPQACRWCEHNRIDDTVTRQLAWGDIRAAATTGDVAGFLVTPLVSMGALALAANDDERLDEMPANILLVVEAVTVSSAVNQLVKFSMGRERPFVADLPAERKGGTEHPADNNLSFYSGHSNLVFALAVSAGTLAHLRGYEGEPYVWGLGVPVAAFVAYSRIAAKKHYLTDVLLGSAAGAAFGFALPWAFHRQSQPSPLTLTPLPNGALVSGRF